MDQADFNPTTMGGDSILYQAIKNNKKLEDIKWLLNDGRNVNDPIITSGPYAGFTALHVACMGDNNDLVGLLINDFKADVNVVAEDGTQPIHLACFAYYFNFRNFDFYTEPIIDKIKMLLEGNANVDAEFGQEIFLKHDKNREWCPDFGNKISLVTYATVYNKPILTVHLIKNKANVNIISLTNKTLLMYAVENYYIDSLVPIARSFMGSELLNHRDNDGVPVSHYPFHPKLYGDYRYFMAPFIGSCEIGLMVRSIIRVGADKYALINDDPKTFLINLAAYRSSTEALDYLLPKYESIAQSKALYYATLPVDENSDKYLRIQQNIFGDFRDPRGMLREQRIQCTELILKDLVNRRTFGLPVPEEEKQLMDKLIATDKYIRDIVHNYKRDFIDGELKNKFIEFGVKKMTLYDLIMQVYNDKKLKLLARDETLKESLRKNNDNMSRDWHWFEVACSEKISVARKRLKLMEKLKKIRHLKVAIPLPYELILDTMEILNNEELSTFISAFFVNS